MKKFWQVRVDNFFKENLKKIDVNDYYINVLTNKYNEPLEYIEKSGSKYIFVCYDSDDISDNKFCWGELKDYDYFITHDFIFCGIISNRKEKLKRLNDIYKSTI